MDIFIKLIPLYLLIILFIIALKVVDHFLRKKKRNGTEVEELPHRAKKYFFSRSEQ